MMERRPELTIIAGPNGAGKSRLCPLYVSTPSFDGDKLMLNIRKEHPDWPARWVSGTVASELEKQKTRALAERTDFAFETNFSSNMVVDMVNEFKAAGYKITLCYFGLLSVDESISRVKLRSQIGGHDVTDEVIRFNFNEGLAKVKQNIHLFENLNFIDGIPEYGRTIALHIEKGRIHRVDDNPPQWFKEQFAKAFSELEEK